jgi:asparagine synthase (glutamine-hydrolysing)
LEPFARALPVRIGAIGLRSVRFGKKFLEYAGQSAMDRFVGFSSYYTSRELQLLLGGISNEDCPYLGVEPLVEAWESRGDTSLVDKMTSVDLNFYLPGLGLAYVDKTSMAASVEVRVPLIDDTLVEYVAALPGEYKVRGGATKVILREAVREQIPDTILRRPKAPFSAPIRSWLRRDLSPMVDEYLGPSRLLERGLVSPEFVRGIVTSHRSGTEDHSLRIWALLTLEVWIQEFIDNRGRFERVRDDLVVETEVPVEAQ